MPTRDQCLNDAADILIAAAERILRTEALQAQTALAEEAA